MSPMMDIIEIEQMINPMMMMVRKPLYMPNTRSKMLTTNDEPAITEKGTSIILNPPLKCDRLSIL